MQILMEIPVISHTHSGALRTVRRGKTLVGIIVHQVCDIVRNPPAILNIAKMGTDKEGKKPD